MWLNVGKVKHKTMLASSLLLVSPLALVRDGRCYAQSSMHDVWPSFECQVILCLFRHWIVLAKFTPSLPPPFWHSKYGVSGVFPLSFQCDRAWWGLLLCHGYPLHLA